MSIGYAFQAGANAVRDRECVMITGLIWYLMDGGVIFSKFLICNLTPQSGVVTNSHSEAHSTFTFTT